MVTSPHHLASEAGARVLRDGGNAIEAVVAMAAALSVVYPHMTSIGGDGFWIVKTAGDDPIGIDACGAAGAEVTDRLYEEHGHAAVPLRGPLAANTMAGALSGWDHTLRISAGIGGRLPLSRLLEDAIWHAENGFAVTTSQADLTVGKHGELAGAPGFAKTFLRDGTPPGEGDLMRLPALAETLRRIGTHGPEDFYRGELARDVAFDLEAVGAPLGSRDLQEHRSSAVPLLSSTLSGGARLFNMPPPTQGLASLMILSLFDRLGISRADGFEHIHGLVEATKQAFLVRDRVIGDPGLSGRVEHWLSAAELDRLAERIDRRRALDWPAKPSGGDTVWMGAIDSSGTAVSYIQSIFFEFGSGCVLPHTGIVWQNRGASFALGGYGPRSLAPGRKPFHTLNPSMALLPDGGTMVYGTMGGEGQPQTQAALFSRHALFGQGLQEAITAPRWLLGKTWGEESVTLKIEDRFEPSVVSALRDAGHQVEIVAPFSPMMGHAGAVKRRSDGTFEGATDPRSDGAAIGF
ncbi:gamma-glutamyltransferase family protein [Corticibacterium sp. UT-5YL-CI-8]|nr:gamma-glutamyltransferase family protein [Tianweitania sp. UT-5YL-CI-8]